MGCQPISGPEGVFDSINFELERTNTSSYDRAIERVESVLKDIEELRYIFSSVYGPMIYESGAIVLKTPELSAAIYGLFFQVARDSKTDVFRNLKLRIEKPFVEITDVSFSGTTQSTLEKINNFLDICFKYQDASKNLSKEISDFLLNYNTTAKKFNEEFSAASAAKHKNIEEFKGMENRNKSRIQSAFSRVNDVTTKIESGIRDIKLMIEKVKKEDQVNIDKERLSKVTSGKREDDNRVLLYTYTVGPKFENIDDYQPIYNKIKLNRKFISSSNIPPSGLLVINKPKVKVEITPTPDDDLNEEELRQLEKAIREEEIRLANQEEEKKQNLVKVKTKANLFEKRLLPLGSWNFSLYNSYSILEQEKLFAKSLALVYEEDILAIGTKSGKVLLYNHKSFEFLNCLEGHSESVKVLSYLHDGVSLISGGKDGRLIKWNIKTGTRTNLEIKNDNQPITAISKNIFSEEIYVGSDKNLYIIDIVTGNLISQMEFHTKITSLKWIKESKLLAVGLKDGKITLCQPSNRSIVQTFKSHSNKVSDLAVVTDSEMNEVLVSISSQETVIRSFKINDVKDQRSFESPHAQNKPRHLIYGNDEKTLITTFADGKFFLNNYENLEKKKYFFASENKITCAFYCDDSKTIIFGNDSGSIDYFVSR